MQNPTTATAETTRDVAERAMTGCDIRPFSLTFSRRNPDEHGRYGRISRQVSGDDLIFSAYGHAVDPVRISASRESGDLAAHFAERVNICCRSVTEMSSVRFLQAGPLSISQCTCDHAVVCLSWTTTP
jgi:hypothetical protein